MYQTNNSIERNKGKNIGLVAGPSSPPSEHGHSLFHNFPSVKIPAQKSSFLVFRRPNIHSPIWVHSQSSLGATRIGLGFNLDSFLWSLRFIFCGYHLDDKVLLLHLCYLDSDEFPPPQRNIKSAKGTPKLRTILGSTSKDPHSQKNLETRITLQKDSKDKDDFHKEVLGCLGGNQPHALRRLHFCHIQPCQKPNLRPSDAICVFRQNRQPYLRGIRIQLCKFFG